MRSHYRVRASVDTFSTTCGSDDVFNRKHLNFDTNII